MGEYVFITGIGSGLGKALAEESLKRGYRVLALSRRLPDDLKSKDIIFRYCDLSEIERVSVRVRELVEGVKHIDLVILNAGVLGNFGDMYEIPLRMFKEVMDINVWANKVIIDTFIENKVKVEMIIGISSGASVNCNRGWNAYAISKASLNCLLKLYAREMEDTHIISLAPGLVLTPMLEEVMKQDEVKYPSVKRIKNSPKRSPEETARLIFDLIPRLREFESGSYVDIRDIVG